MAKKASCSLSFHCKFGDESAGDISSLHVSRDGSIIAGHASKLSVWKKTQDQELSWNISNVLSTPVQGDVNAMCEISVKGRVLLAISVDSSIVFFDQQTYTPIHQMCCNKDEINALVANEKGNVVCSCDDTGEIKLIDTSTYELIKTLTAHENICSTVRFIPRRPGEIVSGGLDCKMIRWNFNRGRPLAVLSQSELHDSSIGSYAINPPMVHTLDVFPSTSTVVCGLGNGVIAVYALKSGKKTELLCTGTIHSASIACVCAKEISESGSSSVRQFVFSGGNDKKVCVSELVLGEKDKKCLQLLSQIDTLSKINCIALDSRETGELSILVSDLTCLISLYKFTC